MDASKYAKSDSLYETAKDHRGCNKQAIIEATGEDTFMGRDGANEQTKMYLGVSSFEKPVVLSPTNVQNIIDQFGVNSKKWEGKRVLITTKDYNIDGNQTVGFIVMPLLDVEFDDDIPFGDEDEDDTPKATKARKRKARRKS